MKCKSAEVPSKENDQILIQQQFKKTKEIRKSKKVIKLNQLEFLEENKTSIDMEEHNVEITNSFIIKNHHQQTLYL